MSKAADADLRARRELEGIPANGRRFVVDGIGIFYFDPGDDRILGEKVVSDMLGLVRQLEGGARSA